MCPEHAVEHQWQGQGRFSQFECVNVLLPVFVPQLAVGADVSVITACICCHSHLTVSVAVQMPVAV